jgi:hypothetical protein
MTPNPSTLPPAPRYPSALRWLEEPLPNLDYEVMGTNLDSDEREMLERYAKNIERLASMHAPRGWNLGLGLMMAGREVLPAPSGNGFVRGGPFEFDPAFAEFLVAFISRLRKLYLTDDQVTFHTVRTTLGRRVPRDHKDAEVFRTFLKQLKQDCTAVLAGEGASVCLHAPNGDQVRADAFFNAWLHDAEFHEKLSSNPKRSAVWEEFPDPLTRAVFINTAFALFAIYGRLGRVAAEVIGTPLVAPPVFAPVPRATPAR